MDAWTSAVVDSLAALSATLERHTAVYWTWVGSTVQSKEAHNSVREKRPDELGHTQNSTLCLRIAYLTDFPS